MIEQTNEVKVAHAPPKHTPEAQDAQEALDGTKAHIQKQHIDIQFQIGPVKEFGHNGTTIEAVLEVCLERLRGFQAGPFACRENALAITNIEQGQMWLERRTHARTKAGVEGTNQNHPPT